MAEKPIEQMTDEELRQEAIKALSGTQQEQQPEEQHRDDQGRFKKKEEAQVEEEEEVQEVDEVVYRRVIDLGDGSGKQVFEAPSMEELIDKLADAQAHATRKIREQAQALKAKPAEPELTEEQKFLKRQRALSEPDTVIEEYVDKRFNEKYGPRVERLEAAAKQTEAQAAEQAWVDSHPEYHAIPKNGQRMMRYLQTYNLEMNDENLNEAFKELTESGLLEAKPQESEAANTESGAETKRIAEPPANMTVRRKVVGGISTKRQAPVEKAPSEPTEADLYKMPMEELEALTRRHLRG